MLCLPEAALALAASVVLFLFRENLLAALLPLLCGTKSEAALAKERRKEPRGHFLALRDNSTSAPLQCRYARNGRRACFERERSPEVNTVLYESE